VTSPALALSTQVTTALLSAVVALAVALLGIAGAIAAQVVATRRAFANSLALFERQNAAQERARAGEVRREDARRFADQRRSTYARLLQAADKLQDAGGTAADAMEAWRQIREEKGADDADAAQARREDDAERSRKQAGELLARIFGELGVVVDELELLASDDVLRTARELRDAATELVPEDLGIPSVDFGTAVLSRLIFGRSDLTYKQARTAFVEAARRELAVTSDE
jgi:hypothetical protein